MNRIQVFLQKNSPLILTCISSIGVVTTSILAVKATPKALGLIKDAEYENDKKLTKFEIVKVAWKPYIPAILSGVTTIVCIFGSNYLNTKSQKALISAYAVLDNSYKQYREKTKELYGEDADEKVMQKIAEDNMNETLLPVEDEVLFFDFQGLRWFTSTIHKVMQAECILLEELRNTGTASLNSYYGALGLPEVDYGDKIGWTSLEANDVYGYDDLQFNYVKSVTKDGKEYYTIYTTIEPTSDYLDFCFGLESYPPIM